MANLSMINFSYYLCHQILETKNKDRLKKSPVDSLSILIFFILGSTNYFEQ